MVSLISDESDAELASFCRCFQGTADADRAVQVAKFMQVSFSFLLQIILLVHGICKFLSVVLFNDLFEKVQYNKNENTTDETIE